MDTAVHNYAIPITMPIITLVPNEQVCASTIFNPNSYYFCSCIAEKSRCWIAKLIVTYVKCSYNCCHSTVSCLPLLSAPISIVFFFFPSHTAAYCCLLYPCLFSCADCRKWSLICIFFCLGSPGVRAIISEIWRTHFSVHLLLFLCVRNQPEINQYCNSI